MRTRLWVAGALACLAATPAAALAGKPADKDKTNAAKECRAERGTTDATREAFAAKYGTESSKGKNAFGKCVSSRAKDERAERRKAKRNAARDCREEREELGLEAFREKYGTAKSKGRNAFGKCVSKQASKDMKKADRADRKQMKRIRNAAQACAAEREEIGEQAFAEKYGTEKSKRKNAFGKCVSGTARSS